MGGSSSSSSSTSTTTVNTALEGENPVSFVSSDNNEVSFTDHKAIASAFGFGEDVARRALDFGGDALDSVDRANRDALIFGEDALRRVESSSRNALSTTRGLVNDQVEQIKNLAQSIKLGSSEIGQKMLYAVLAALVVLGLGFIFLRVRN